MQNLLTGLHNYDFLFLFVNKDTKIYIWLLHFGKIFVNWICPIHDEVKLYQMVYLLHAFISQVFPKRLHVTKTSYSFASHCISF